MSEYDLVARKIVFAKWKIPPFSRGGRDIQADVFKQCIRPNKNSLSFYLCSEQRTSLNDIVLEISAHRDELAKMELLLMPLACLQQIAADNEYPIDIGKNKNTAVKGIGERHINLEALTVDDMTEIARLIANRFREESEDYQELFTLAEVKKLFIDNQNKLDEDNINKKLLSQLRIINIWPA